ncbi:GNAT family N-acetyltransferase [Anaerocolumna sedimenticola]|uniref:GNAT family N-acetyltransferase n=1 Tax=Anaerocolumna sedimenticola TaxID=2696063 RepID=A0A6P1TLE8_9FIRM|nr:GNAT family N-acetyltransferase [Anaerocolumna sedimenticola]QHQ60736.1 GNAT family N-acetyltransferase [Anaerocolumna sedimenticola]
MIEYRKATLEDADLIAKIRADFLGEVNHLTQEDKQDMCKANQDYLKKALADGSFAAWLAVLDEEVVGTSGITFYHVPPNMKCPNGKAAYISNMFSYPQYRKQGIATKLFSLIVEEAKIQGHNKVLLNATDMGKPLYERYGFKEVQGDMVYYIA